MDILLQDIRLAFRQLARTPWFTAFTTLTLALGIGASSAVFTTINAALFKALPVDEPKQLVVILGQNEQGRIYEAFSYPDYVDYREHNKVFCNCLPGWARAETRRHYLG